MDGLTFHKVMRLIKARYLNSSVNRVSVTKDSLYISLFKDGQVILMFKSTPPPSLEITSVAMGDSVAILANLNGSRLVAVYNRPYDRVGRLVFEKRRPSGKLVTYNLILEPMGNYAHTFITGDDGTILYRLSGKNIDPDRDIGVGKPYMEPKQNKRFSLSTPGDVTDFKELTGFYPLTANIANAIKDTSDFSTTAENIRRGLEEDDIFYLENGKIIPFKPSETAQPVPFEELTYSKSTSGEKTDRKLADNLRKFYEKQRMHYLKLWEKLVRELSSSVKYMEIHEEADLIKSNIHIIKGTGMYRLSKYGTNSVSEVEYTYDSTEEPSVYAEKLYKKTAKLKRSVPLLKERIAEVEQLAKSAEEQLYYVENADLAELKEISELLKKKSTGKSVKKQEISDFLEFHRGGTLIYIGKNSASNHKLLFLFAQPSDMWLHAQNIPSAHCIIRSNGHISDDTIEFAARLVASYSRNKHELRVPVDYTLKKYVKKPKNTPVGFVIYDHFKTVTVKPFTDEEIMALQ